MVASAVIQLEGISASTPTLRTKAEAQHHWIAHSVFFVRESWTERFTNLVVVRSIRFECSKIPRINHSTTKSLVVLLTCSL